ncbi:PLC-like phosphodiesterase [Fusarium albosuccineum]|uniref:Altered inheritance of mitochondria protein 6 n=1 Tax=Fusarium albosuccineum TaxID=1237068 RepID=A0A8H4PGZ4_9HYPO|nr:PLC-like phosphodiesterase [Fusarium albosuccineum]
MALSDPNSRQDDDSERCGNHSRSSRKMRLWRHFRTSWLRYIVSLLALLSIGQFVYIYRLDMGLTRIPNDPFDLWFGQDINYKSPAIWDTDRQSFLRHTRPVPVHSHNDYERRIPLFEALGSGCISIEADVFLRDSNLLVGHTTKGLSDDKTLQSLYLEPLQRILEEQNAHTSDETRRGVFDPVPEQTLILLVDVKSSGTETFAKLDAQLQPLRDLDYLTYWNGTARVVRPLTVVASGNTPFSSVLAMNKTHRDIFWDAKLEQLVSIEDDFGTEPPAYKYNLSNSYFASTKFQNAILWRPTDDSALSKLTPRERDMASTQIQQAKSRGLLARYWDTPSQPPNVREIAWRVLVDHQVGLLNMDELGIVRARAKGWGALHDDSL